MTTSSSKTRSPSTVERPLSAVLPRDIRPEAARSTEPHDVAAEQALLGILMYDERTCESVAQLLEPVYFYEPFHQRLYQAIVHQTQLARAPEPILLAGVLKSDPTFDELGGLRYLADLVDRAPNSSVATDYADLIVRLWQRRDAVRTTRAEPSPRGTEAAQAAFATYRVRTGGGLRAIPDDTQIFAVPQTEEAERALKGSPVFELVRQETPHARRPSSIAEEVPDLNAVDENAFKPSARARAILRGVAHAEADLKDSGGAFDVDEVRTLLRGVSRQAIDKRVSDGSLLAVPGPNGRRRFPAIQFKDDGSLVPGLKAVQSALGYSSPWSVLNFLINGHDLLDGDRPIDLMRLGEVERVEQAARLSGVDGA